MSSVQKIVDTTVEIVRGRKKPHLANKRFYPFFRSSETAPSSALPPVEQPPWTGSCNPTKSSPAFHSQHLCIISSNPIRHLLLLLHRHHHRLGQPDHHLLLPHLQTDQGCGRQLQGGGYPGAMGLSNPETSPFERLGPSRGFPIFHSAQNLIPNDSSLKYFEALPSCL